MELEPRSHQKIADLIGKGVDIPNPLTLDIGEEFRPTISRATASKFSQGAAFTERRP